MLRKVKYLALNLLNLPGWHTNRRLVVIESDDWGSVRMPSKKIYDLLIDKGVRVNNCPYCSFDTLESEDDLSSLFDVLISVRDRNDNFPIITANTIVANPDFQKIKNDNYLSYYYESFTETLKNYEGCEGSLNLWKQGMSEKLFHPQFHGREHLDIAKWMKSLQSGNKDALIGIENNLTCLSHITSNTLNNEFTNAFASSDPDVISSFDEIISDGMRIFKEIFDYNSASFIAPCYAWGKEVERITSSLGIKYLQGNFAQYNSDTQLAKYNYTGKRNDYDQIYLTRNCTFEPSLDKSKDWISSCLKDIKISFLFNKPAIISTHRLNFVGGIVEENRTRNLNLFATLLKSIIQKWPDVEFLTSDQVGDLVNGYER